MYPYFLFAAIQHSYDMDWSCIFCLSTISLDSITSRCSGKEPELLPRTRTRESGRNRAYNLLIAKATQYSGFFTYCLRSRVLHVTVGNPQTFGFEFYLRSLHMHLVGDRSTNRLLYPLLLHRANETQPGRNNSLRL